MARIKYGLKEFKQDPVRHIVIPMLIEFLSQFMFTFWGVMAEKPQQLPSQVTGTNPNITTSAADDHSDYVTKFFGPAFQTAISVWICIFVYSKMSYAPAQFNPAITTTLVVVGTVSPLLFIPNIVIQCISSTLAALVSQLIRGAPPPALIIPDDISSWSIFFNEVIMVASVTIIPAELTQNPKMNHPLGDVAIAMAVFMCLLCAPWMHVIGLSTSRVFGPAVLTGGKAWNRHWLLWIADLTGATLSGLFWLTFLGPADRSWLGKFTKENVKKTDILMDEKTTDGESQ